MFVNYIYDRFFTITGSNSPVSFPSGTASIFRMKADANNGGAFLIGNYLDNVGRYPLYAGNEIDWTPSPASFRMEEMVHSNVSGTMDRLYVWMKV